MNTIVKYNQHMITVIGTSTDPWFSASDVGSILGYRKSDLLSLIPLSVDSSDWKFGHDITTLYHIVPLDMFLEKSPFLNESGLMDLLCSCRQIPEAKKFKQYYFSVLRNNLLTRTTTSLDVALEENERLQNLLDGEIENRKHLERIVEQLVEHHQIEKNDQKASWYKLFL